MLSAPTLPKSLIAGDSLTAKIATVAHRAADGWAAELRLIGQGVNSVTAGTETADGWAFSISAATSASLTPGAYSAIILLTASGQRVSSPTAALTVCPDPAATGTFDLDTRGPARRALDELQAAYRAYISTGQLMSGYTINGRAVQFVSVADLISAIEHAKREAAAEDIAAHLAAGRPSPTRILVRM